ncbi:hypothetical protein D3C77_779600 [compost metagenome]
MAEAERSTLYGLSRLPSTVTLSSCTALPCASAMAWLPRLVRAMPTAAASRLRDESLSGAVWCGMRVFPG